MSCEYGKERRGLFKNGEEGKFVISILVFR